MTKHLILAGAITIALAGCSTPTPSAIPQGIIATSPEPTGEVAPVETAVATPEPEQTWTEKLSAAVAIGCPEVIAVAMDTPTEETEAALMGLTATELQAVNACINPTPSPAALVKRGTIDRVGDWDVKVAGKVNFNAWKIVHRENMFNEAPPKGSVMVIIPVQVWFRGEEATTLLGIGPYVVGNATGQEINTFDDPNCGVIPKDLDMFKTIRPGGSLKGNLCFVVEKADVKTLRLGWPQGTYSDEPDVEFSLR